MKRRHFFAICASPVAGALLIRPGTARRLPPPVVPPTGIGIGLWDTLTVRLLDEHDQPLMDGKAVACEVVGGSVWAKTDAYWPEMTVRGRAVAIRLEAMGVPVCRVPITPFDLVPGLGSVTLQWHRQAMLDLDGWEDL